MKHQKTRSLRADRMFRFKAGPKDSWCKLLKTGLAETDYEIGQSVAIGGKLTASNYEKDGNQYYNVRLVGNNISIIA